MWRVTEDLAEMDFATIHGFISQSYWAKGIPADTLYLAMKNAMCFALLDSQNRLAAFARVITDKATFAYLADVFVLEEYRAQGLSKQLMQHIMSHSQLQGLRRFMLATQDAHGLYKAFGFAAVGDDVNTLMQIRQRNPYAGSG